MAVAPHEGARKPGGPMRAEDIAGGRRRWRQRYDEAGERLRSGGGAAADGQDRLRRTTLSGSEVEPVYGPPDGAERG